MTSALQNRLVGTIIVVALVVILVPEILDGEKRISKQEFIDIPPVAELVQVQNTAEFDTKNLQTQLNQAIEVIDEYPVDDPEIGSAKPPVNLKDSSNGQLAQGEKQTIVDIAASSSAKPSGPSKQSDEFSQIDIKDSGWVVQLGSFRHEKNVKDLLRKLNVAGYRAYSRPVMTSMGKLTKVFVGPELDKEKLELALPHLTEITKLKGRITPFEVNAG
jgi:DedD protein